MLFAVDTYQGKTKFAKLLRCHRVVLRQLFFQNIYNKKPCECTKRKLTWGTLYAPTHTGLAAFTSIGTMNFSNRQEPHFVVIYNT